jgi:hypothetical protein
MPFTALEEGTEGMPETGTLPLILRLSDDSLAVVRMKLQHIQVLETKRDNQTIRAATI